MACCIIAGASLGEEALLTEGTGLTRAPSDFWGTWAAELLGDVFPLLSLSSLAWKKQVLELTDTDLTLVGEGWCNGLLHLETYNEIEQ